AREPVGLVRRLAARREHARHGRARARGAERARLRDARRREEARGRRARAPDRPRGGHGDRRAHGRSRSQTGLEGGPGAAMTPSPRAALLFALGIPLAIAPAVLGTRLWPLWLAALA